jgi:hypothetical protein
VLIPINFPDKRVINIPYKNIDDVITNLPDILVANILRINNRKKIENVFENSEAYTKIFRQSFKESLINTLPIAYDYTYEDLAVDISISCYLNTYVSITTFNRVTNIVYAKVMRKFDELKREERGDDDNDEEDYVD